jgi:hypothetical protein
MLQPDSTEAVPYPDNGDAVAASKHHALFAVLFRQRLLLAVSVKR